MNEKGILTKMAKSLHLACRASGLYKDNAREIVRTYHWRLALCDRNGKEWGI